MNAPHLDGWSNEIAMLACPECGENSLHQRVVRVLNRAGTDTGVRIEVSGINLRALTRDEGPFIGERQAIAIDFDCEACDGPRQSRRWLIIQQHKGLTLLRWSRESIPQ